MSLLALHLSNISVSTFLIVRFSYSGEVSVKNAFESSAKSLVFVALLVVFFMSLVYMGNSGGPTTDP